jgi:hypothetical protein
MVTDTLSFDQTFADAGDISLARRLIESEQLLFENDFPNEAEKVRIISDELVFRIHAAVLANPAGVCLDISEWKNRQIKILMIEVMRFSKESYERYLQREIAMVTDARNHRVMHGHTIRSL